MKKNHILRILFLLCFLASTFCQNPEPIQTNLELNNLLNVTNLPNGFTYYAVNFQLTKSDLKLFLITVKTDQLDTVEIFTSIYYEGIDNYFKYPNWENNTQACSYSSIDTCAVVLPDIKQNETKNVTVYIGVELFFSDQMTILTSLNEQYKFRIGVNYDIDFAVWQSAVFTLPAEDVNQYEQLVVQMQYDSFNDIGRFALYAGVNQIPNTGFGRIQSKYMGAFTQILVLQPLQDNETYYIVLEGQLGTEFDVIIRPFEVSSPKLQMNDTVFYYSSGSADQDKKELNFSLSIDYSQQQQILPLLIDLNSLGGYGEFQVDYCDGLTNFTFANLNGESGEVIIPVEQRKQCYESISDKGGLMIENLIVSVKNVPWYFSYSIGVFEGQFQLMISPYSEKMGTLVATETSRVYQMEGYINESFVLKFKTIAGQSSLNFTLFQCRPGILVPEKCSQILNSVEDAIIDPMTPEYKQFNYTCQENRNYRLKVSHGSMEKFDSEYVLLLLPLNSKPSTLTPSKPIYSIISKNQYQYFVVNLTLIQKTSNITITNNTNILITMVETNGDCMMLTSLEEKFPKYDQIFQTGSKVDYSWNGKKLYNLNPDTRAIYIGILGTKQSIYHLQVSLSVNQDTPESYTKLVSDKLLSFTLSSERKEDHVLLSYTAHSIPYTIIISPSPACIVYSYSLPFTNNSCRQLPAQITQKTIYLKVFRTSQQSSEDDGDFKFAVYVYSGSHYLFEYAPILIACQDTCYEYVTVFVPETIKIVHKGMGFIGRKNSTEAFSNQKMQITCEKGYPCFLTINASLPYGGTMQLFYDSINAQQVEWITKPLTFEKASEPKLFFMQIRSWDSLNTAIFYTEGVSVTIYYNIFSMRENATNALQYEFPNSFSYMRKSSGNPLRRFHVVEFDPQLIEELGCKDDNDVCIATLAVYPNKFAQYSTQYVNKTIGYFSCNTYQYYIPMNSPYQLSEEYSLVYFSHELSQFQQQSIPDFYYVKIQPLSSCRPQIFAPFTGDGNMSSYNKDMPYFGIYKIDSSTLDPQNPEIKFTVSTDTPCEYTLWLLDCEIQPVIENVNYELASDNNGTILFVYSDKYLWSHKKFTINFDQQMNEIMIDEYRRYPNGTIKQPSKNQSLSYASQSKSLQFASGEALSRFYIIKASTKANNKVNMKISTYEGDTLILTNQIQKFMFGENSNSMTFRYFSNNDFLIFVTTDWGNVRITVTDYKRDQDREIVNQIINDESDPWIRVNAIQGDIRGYVITLENVLFSNDKNRNLQQADTKYPKVNFHIEETGTIGLPQLYDGVALFDAFYNEDAQNCYKYVSQAIVGRPSLIVDLIFGSQFINKVPEIRSRVSISDGQKLDSTWTSIPTGYRLQTEYYGNQVYQFCFSINQKANLVSKQFYMIVENLEYSLRHLTLDVPLSSQNPGSYQIYQYVATENQNLLIEVVNCMGKPTLLGAKQYNDIYLGQVSELGAFYRDETKSVAMKSVQIGYFYFGIKLTHPQDRYKIRVQLMQENEKLHYDKFELKEKTINRPKNVDQNGRVKIRVNLPPINNLGLPKEVKVHHITYNLLVDDLKVEHQYSSNVIAKCPVLANRNLSSYKFIQNVSQNVKTETNSLEQVRIDIPISNMPQNFSLTGYVEVAINEPYTQTLTYYYDSSIYNLNNIHQKSRSSIFSTVFGIMLILAVSILAYIFYRKWKNQQKNSRVAFEMANYNYEPNPTKNEESKATEGPAQITSSPSRTLKKALNQDVGYGEFVDESM